ncbi:MAG: SET domain-containing protein [Nanoarchaeota archaeon]
MLLVKTKLGLSKIHGIGIFADQPISKGTTVWKFNPLIDKYISKSDLKQIPLVLQEQLHKYIFLDKNQKKYLLCGDDARFFNHSNKPNCDDSVDNVTTAIKEIKKGEELTVNYKLFYGNIEEHSEIK